MSDAAEFIVSGTVTAAEIAQVFSERFAVARAPEYSATLRFHDTFDWRLYAAGWVLEEEARARAGTVRCYNRRSGAVVKTSHRGKNPRLSDLNGVMAELQLDDALGLRALMPQVELSVRVSELNLLNEDEKTVVRCRVERVEPGADDPGQRPFTAVRLLGLRGYDGELQRASSQVATIPNATHDECALLHAALRSAGRAVDDYIARPHVTLSPSASALSWTREICSQLLDVVISNEFGIAQDIDTEFLHDFRVSVRRTRSALGQIRHVFTPESIAHFRTEFAWLGQITSPMRDIDVFLLHFSELRAAVPEELHAGIDGFHDYLREQRARERRRLLRHLRGARYRTLLEDWRRFLDDPPAHALGVMANEKVVSLAEKHTLRLWRRVRKEGRRIDDSSPAEALHDLRKTCKKLRYMLEFFAPLQAAEGSSRLLKRLKRLQGNLGDFQDRAVQIEALHVIAEKMMASGQVDAVLAIGALIQRAADRGARARGEFHAEFHHFDTRSTARLFANLFAQAPGARR